MVTTDYGAQWVSNRYRRPVTLLGLSTDSKPTTNIANGSVFIEMDTSKIYFFDADGAQWIEWGAQ